MIKKVQRENLRGRLKESIRHVNVSGKMNCLITQVVEIVGYYIHQSHYSCPDKFDEGV